MDQTNDMDTSQVGILGIMAASDSGPGFFAMGGQAIVDNGHRRAPSQSRPGQMWTEQLTCFPPQILAQSFDKPHSKVTLQFMQLNFLDFTHCAIAGTYWLSSCTKQLR